MPVTTKTQIQVDAAPIDQVFAQQLASMLDVVTQAKQKHRAVAGEAMKVDDILLQANDGISLAQIIDASMQDAGQMLAHMYYQLEAASRQTYVNLVEVNNQLRGQIDNLARFFDQVTFKQQAIFKQPKEIFIPKGVEQGDCLTLSIPNTNLNQLGLPSWQLVDGPVLPQRHGDILSFQFDRLQLRTSERISLTLGDANILEECVDNIHTTMGIVADLINQAELDWLNQAVVHQGQLQVYAPDILTTNLFIEQQSVAIEDSVASLQVNNQSHFQQAMQTIISAINQLADYRDVATSIANELHDAVYELMSKPVDSAMSKPLAEAMAKDVQNMFAHQPAQSVQAQANLED